MSLVDSPKPEYLQEGGPSEKKAPWLRRHFWKLTLVLLNLALATVIVTTVMTRPDLFRASGGLTGQVVSAQGSPVRDAQVFISSAERWVTVDGQGRFAVERIPAGPTVVIVVKLPQSNGVGGEPSSQAVTIVRNETLDLGTLVLIDAP